MEAGAGWGAVAALLLLLRCTRARDTRDRSPPRQVTSEPVMTRPQREDPAPSTSADPAPPDRWPPRRPYATPRPLGGSSDPLPLGGPSDPGPDAARSPSLERDEAGGDGPAADPTAGGLHALEDPPSEARRETLRVLECGSAKEKSTFEFDFSPKLLADSLTSPRYFTPPESVSPMFFAEPSPKSVYYDTVRSPRFFPETPREAEAPRSPRALGDRRNRNEDALPEKPSSPRTLAAKPRSPKVHSPKAHGRDKENRFTFEEGTRPRRYGGRSSVERDRDLRKHRRHDSCDADFENVENDVVDCCARLDSVDIEREPESPSDESAERSTGRSNSARVRRQRLKSISLDSDNAKIIEQNLGLPIAKQMKDQINEAHKNRDASATRRDAESESPSTERPVFKFEQTPKEPDEAEEEPKSPDLKQKKTLRHSSDTQSFLDMPRFSPKEFEITITSEEGTTVSADTRIERKGSKNLRNLTIDLTKRDSDLEKELLEFEKLYTNAEERKVKTPTLKVKATSLDSSETVNLSLPQEKTLDVPQNSVSVPNTPKRHIKRILTQKKLHEQHSGGKVGYNSLQYGAEQRRMFLKGHDSGIFLRENHANLMLYQPGASRAGSRTMGSFDENVTDYVEIVPEIGRRHDLGQTLGFNSLHYKQNLSVSSTNLKTLPEGVPSDDFEPGAEDDKFGKKLHRRNSNQSLMHSSHGLVLSARSLQGSNCSLNCAGVSRHVRSSLSNFSLGSSERLAPAARVPTASDAGNCLLRRRGSNNSLTLNIQRSDNDLSRHSSNGSLNRDAKLARKRGLLERRSSNASLTLNIDASDPRPSANGSVCDLSRCESDRSVDRGPRGGIPETGPPRDGRGKSLSTDDLIPGSRESRARDRCVGFGSHDDLRSSSYGGRGEGAIGGEGVAGFVRNITTEPLSPQTTSEDFRLYLANMHHLQNASSVLTRRRLRDLDEVFQNGYSKVKCHGSVEGRRCCSGRASDPQMDIPEACPQPCSEYQKTLLRGLHQEFWDMPTNFQEKPLVSGSHAKNRYKSILPNEHSRFVLRPSDAADPDGYINANYIKGHEYTRNCYIATQGPLQHTVADFWLMVRQNAGAGVGGVQKVVMLTNFVENDRQKCERYFPLEPGEVTQVGGVVVHNAGVAERGGYTVRRLEVRSGEEEPLAVDHYWFHNWADHKCPKDVNALLELSLDVLGSCPDEGPPVVVHCSAGIGRTGCLIAILNGIRQLSTEGRVDVLAIVSNMRLDRGGMVQNSEQYELVHKVLCAFERACLSPL